MQRAATQCAFHLKVYKGWLANLEDQHLGLEPGPGLKTAGWLLGHLVVTGDFGRKLCGLPPIAPKTWRPLFSPGTTPSHDAASYPPMKELLDAFHAVYTDLSTNGPSAAPGTLALPNPYESARQTFPTAGDFAAYLLTGHLAYHLGQLSMWRAAAAATDARLRRPQ